jgi:ABC-type multidrug transport system ATPase subunit
LRQLNLTEIQHQPIRILSGGQQRRVNLAYELIRYTELILLDEPTTGLSVLDAKVVIQMLRELANSGRTIIAVIHQPSLDVYDMFDLVGILFKGRLIYYGPPGYSFTHFECDYKHPEEIFYKLESYQEVDDINVDSKFDQTYACRDCSV